LRNQYGPSESHVVTDYPMPNSIDDWQNLPPIGRPIANTQVYLLNKNLDVVPVGESGELYLGGVCLARGYLGRPELTAERFIPHPFSPSGARLYQTTTLVGIYRTALLNSSDAPIIRFRSEVFMLKSEK
jgi:non-ribosomal peptide synthetase component F